MFVPAAPNSQRPVVPRAAYVHVPFCSHRCGYCNFALVADRLDLVPAYLEAIERELEMQVDAPQQVDTLYFGGGTPTQLGPEGFTHLARLVTRWHPLARSYEWTVEANPIDMTPPLADALAAAGVNRLSIGAQSFNAGKLLTLERDHGPGHIYRSVDLARQRGMSVSLDLIFASPFEQVDEWSSDLEEAVFQRPDHISMYGLTFEKGTTFWNRLQRGVLDEADDELQREMYLAGIDRLAAAGFDQYEISSFARPGHRSRHNQAYWRGDEYFAVGPGAARYVGGVRETNHRSTTTYLKRVLAGESPVAEREQLTDLQRARERLVFALRRLEGVDRDEFAAGTGYTIDELASPAITRYVGLGLLYDDGQRVKLTREGLLVSDALWPDFL